MRLFYGLDDKQIVDSDVVNTDVLAGSLVSSSSLGSTHSPLQGSVKGSVKGSVLTGVRCKYIEAENCILINVTAERIIAKPGSIIYNIVAGGDDNVLIAEPGQVLAGVFSDDGSQHVIRSNISIDGGKLYYYNTLITIVLYN